MKLIMKGLKLIGLGIALWGLGLSWPDEINQVLTPLMMIRLMLGFGVMVLVTYAFGQHLDQRRDHQRDGACQDHPSQPIPPTPAALTQ
jgi:hypothetical protein